MADAKISELPAATALDGTGQWAVVQGGATKRATDAQIATYAAAVISDAAPAALDTLNELAAALGDDANFAATVTTALAGKATPAYADGAASSAVSAHEAAPDPHPQYLTQAEADALGGSGSTQGKHAVPIEAGSMSPSVTEGCASYARVATGANQPDVGSLNFDSTTQEFAQFWFTMPRSWDEGTVSFRAIWSHSSTTTDFGVAWQLQAVAVSDDENIGTAYGTAVVVTDIGGTANKKYTTQESAAITIAGLPAAEDTVFFRVARVPADIADTLAIDARLQEIVLYITTNAGTDA